MSVLAVDIGSSTCKAVVFASGGEVLAQPSAHYTPEFPGSLFAEMDPDKFWNAVCSCCRNACQHVTDPVQALCLSSHAETFVAVDSARPASDAGHSQPGQSCHPRVSLV